MRADRLLTMMILLQNRQKMTTKELAHELGVSSRTVLRDMDALSIAGIPVVAERGKTGGWRLMDHFRSQLSGVKLEEMKSLFILPSEKILEDLGLSSAGAAIREKLLATLPDSSKGVLRPFAEKVYIDTGTWKPFHEKQNALHVVQQALWQDQKLSILYQKANGDRSQRVVSPLGLVLKGSAWYLVARCESENDCRNFRMSRILHAEMMPEAFTRPAGFHLPDYWKKSMVQFNESLPVFEAKVLAHVSIIGRLTFTEKFVEIEIVDPTPNDGMVLVHLRCNTEQEAIQYVLGFGGRMKVNQPEEMVEKIVRQAKAVIQLYE